MRTAVVVGAGVGGLAAAGALATSGWQVTLLERGDRLRGTGGAQVIWPNGAAALHALGLHLGDISFAMPAGGIRRPDGRWIVESTARDGEFEARGTSAENVPFHRSAGDPLSPYLDNAAGSPPPAVMPQPGPAASGATESGATRAPFVVHADDLHDALMAGLGDKIEIRTGVEITSVRVGEASWPAVDTARHTFQADLVLLPTAPGV